MAAEPDRLWVADLIHVRSHICWTYLVFIGVLSRAIVSWQAFISLRSDLAIDALERAINLGNGRELAA